MTITTEFTLTENQFISDLPLEIKHKLTHLEAPTGRGKTTFVVEQLAKKTKVIMLCPVKVQVAQLAHDFKGNKKVQCITGDEKSNGLHGDIIICVYDRLQQLIDSGIHLSHYTLVVDEAHKVYQAASYRSAALSVIVEQIIKGSFKQVLTISATFQPDIFPIDFDEQIVVEHQHENQPDIEVMYYEKKTYMELKWL